MREYDGIMRRAMLVAVALLSCLAVGGEADAEGFFSGNELWDECRNPDKLVFCYGYIIGVTDALGMEQIVLKEVFHYTEKPLFCFGTGVRAEQAVDVVTAYLRDHPESRNLSPPTLVMDALKEKFPCN